MRCRARVAPLGAASHNPSLPPPYPDSAGKQEREGRPTADGARGGTQGWALSLPSVRFVLAPGCAAKAMAKGGAATVLTVLAAAALPPLEHPAKNDESLSLLVVGDWCCKGECNPFRVAQQAVVDLGSMNHRDRTEDFTQQTNLT
ncbi:uncharacterized protein [Miscanthus floridulus]|uniref:uncharacterized protein n=1 Tax=Miscanthus floridulus TaxID=154761 RepID=UPI00345A54D4